MMIMLVNRYFGYVWCSVETITMTEGDTYQSLGSYVTCAREMGENRRKISVDDIFRSILREVVLRNGFISFVWYLVFRGDHRRG